VHHGKLSAKRLLRRIDGATKVRVHETLRLFDGDSFRQPRDSAACVVDGNVDAAGIGDDGIHSSLDRGVVGYIEFENVYWRILVRQGTDFRGILGIAASRIAHCREDEVPFTRQRFGVVGTTWLELMIHASLWRYRENRLAHSDESVSRYEKHAWSSFSAIDYPALQRNVLLEAHARWSNVDQDSDDYRLAPLQRNR
jgi:hypothetical protein